jgi:HAD-superfamily hydrolase, subfamily IIB
MIKMAGVENIEEVIKANISSSKFLCLIGGQSEIVLEKITEKVSHLEDVETSVVCNYTYKTKEHTFKSKYIDIMKIGCSKKNAIIMLSERLGIKQEEIIVMGDGGNDISMFECAGLRIAMENAEEYLKEKADYITVSNNENGVAKAINKYIFNEN